MADFGGFGGLGPGDQGPEGPAGGASGGGPGGFGFDSRSLINDIMNVNPVTAVMNAILYGGTLFSGGKGLTFGDIVQGDPGGRGPGFGGPAGSTLVQKQVAQALAPAPPAAPLEPAPVVPPATERRKRVGRQETILTKGVLGEASVLKPTLLGQ